MIMLIILAAIAYALGSVNSAIIVSKLMGLEDPRSGGSKNPGATNMLRTGNKQAAAIVLVADFLKGLIAVWLAKSVGMEGFGLGVIGIAVTAGHIFPAFFEFKGGKGVATSLGAVFAISSFAGIIAVATWIGIVYVKKIVSLASLAACAVAAVIVLFTNTAAFIPVAVMMGLVVWRHMENIERLKNGTESKIEI
ncbi:MAG: glycerol-3-phosphate 1-O-acyltransferase PlsY [Coxiellaceae bacterium]|nr:glycerol-3-phosphate 1-O-acyltransferase PlsY [Coxiellaceae bacterium]